MDIADLKMPSNTHAVVLTGRDVLSGETLHAVIVWADRIHNACPRCGQPTAREIDDCPALLDPGAGAGGAVQPVSQQHGCGRWLDVDYTEVKAGPVPDILPETCDDCESTGVNCDLHDGPEYDDQVAPGITADMVLAAAGKLAEYRTAQIAKQTAAIEAGLRQDLRFARELLAEDLRKVPVEDGDDLAERVDAVATGSETNPGVCFEDGRWSAWDYNPAVDGDPIIVYAEDQKGLAK